MACRENLKQAAGKEESGTPSESRGPFQDATRAGSSRYSTPQHTSRDFTPRSTTRHSSPSRMIPAVNEKEVLGRIASQVAFSQETSTTNEVASLPTKVPPPSGIQKNPIVPRPTRTSILRKSTTILMHGRKASTTSQSMQRQGTVQPMQRQGSVQPMQRQGSHLPMQRQGSLLCMPTKGAKAGELKPTGKSVAKDDKNMTKNTAKNPRSASATPLARSGSSNSRASTVPMPGRQVGDQKKDNRERVMEANKMKVFETAHKKLKDMQSDFFHKFDNLKEGQPDFMKGHFKFVSMVVNDECKLVFADEDLLRIPKKLPPESVNDLKERVKMGVNHCLDLLYHNLSKFNVSLGEFEFRLAVDLVRNRIEKSQNDLLEQLSQAIDELCRPQEEYTNSQKLQMQKEFHECRRHQLLAEHKVYDLKRTHVEELLQLERVTKAKYEAELAKRDEQIHRCNRQMMDMNIRNENEKVLASMKSADIEAIEEEVLKLKEELVKSTKTISHLNKRLYDCDLKMASQVEIISKNGDRMQSLENELSKAHQIIMGLKSPEYQTTSCDDKDSLIAELKKKNHCLEENNVKLQAKVHDLSKEVDMVKRLNNALEHAERKVEELELKFRSTQEKLNKTKKHDFGKSDRASGGTALNKEAEEELGTARLHITLLEEQAERDKQLLQVRSDFIVTLQKQENELGAKIEELYNEVKDKNAIITQINEELSAKSEAFNNLFNTLSTKQMELTRQDHVFKLLEQCNERNQMLRVKQESRIAKMDEEIAHLKSTMDVYRRILVSHKKKQNVLFEFLPDGQIQLNENDACQDLNCSYHRTPVQTQERDNHNPKDRHKDKNKDKITDKDRDKNRNKNRDKDRDKNREKDREIRSNRCTDIEAQRKKDKQILIK